MRIQLHPHTTIGAHISKLRPAKQEPHAAAPAAPPLPFGLGASIAKEEKTEESSNLALMSVGFFVENLWVALGPTPPG